VFVIVERVRCRGMTVGRVWVLLAAPVSRSSMTRSAEFLRPLRQEHDVFLLR
jgi:hypothetical protein